LMPLVKVRPKSLKLISKVRSTSVISTLALSSLSE
jgi:hypothetical protein